MKKVTIVGAGFAGLTVARELLARGIAVEILEKSNRPGGLIGSFKSSAGLIETGATSILRTEKVDRLFAELGVPILEPSPESKKRLFFIGKLTRWPLSLMETAALAVRAARAKIKKTLKPRAGETLAEWGRRNLGKPAVDRLLGAALQGIYATDAERLSASLVLGPMFAKKKRERYRGIVSAKGGVFALIHALENDVLKKGGVIRYNQDVTTLPKPVILATSVSAAARLLKDEDAALARRLSSLKMSPLVSLTAFYSEPTGPKAFGCLVPRNFGVRALGVLLNHAIFPGRDSKSGETWIFGGSNDESIAALSDDQLKDLQKNERNILFGKTDAPVDLVITRWMEGLPNYDLVLEDALEDLRPPPGIYLHGNWLGGIGLSKILERSGQLADLVAKDFP